jgi:hypothetical protein
LARASPGSSCAAVGGEAARHTKNSTFRTKNPACCANYAAILKKSAATPNENPAMQEKTSTTLEFSPVKPGVNRAMQEKTSAICAKNAGVRTKSSAMLEKT